MIHYDFFFWGNLKTINCKYVMIMFRSNSSKFLKRGVILEFICSSMEVRASLVVLLFTMMIVVVSFTHE